MTIYDLMILVIFIGLICSSFNGRLNSKYTICCMIFIYFIISMRSLDSDRDAFVYDAVFNKLTNVRFNELITFSAMMGQEIGFVFTMKICNYLGFNFFEFRFIYNLFCLLALMYIIVNYIPSKYRLVSYLIYVSMFMLFRDFTQIRFSLSCLLSIIALLKCLEDNFIKSLSLLFIAILFHNSALICLPIIVFIYKYKNYTFLYSLNFFILTLIVGFFVYFINPIDYIVSLSIMPSQLTRYEGTQYLSSVNSSFGIGFFIAIIICLLLSIKYKKIHAGDNFKILYITMLFSVFSTFMFSSSPILMRMQLLLFSGIIFLPSVFYEYFLKKEIYANYIFQIILGIVFCFYFYKNLESGIVNSYGVF